VITIHVPALRERGDDLRLLAEYFLEFYGRQHKRRLKGFTQAALRAIMAHPWPGNVRELENRVQRSVILAQDAYLRPEDLELQSAGGAADRPDAAGARRPSGAAGGRAHAHAGNVARAAQ
jgi:DNA-binding NtrC family response regulator